VLSFYAGSWLGRGSNRSFSPGNLWPLNGRPGNQSPHVLGVGDCFVLSRGRLHRSERGRAVRIDQLLGEPSGLVDDLEVRV
jgi:hypothetical protein